MESGYEFVPNTKNVSVPREHLDGGDIEYHCVSPHNLQPNNQSNPTESSSLLNPAMRLKITKFRDAFANRNLLVDFLAILFGIGAWIGVNSTYVQLPILVSNAPEGWNLPSYLVVIIQIGNIGPLIYTLLQRIKAFKDSYMIYAILVIGTIAALMMALFYKETAVWFGRERSIAMFFNAFFLALVGCTSSVLFMPYMGRFREIYLISYLIGEGLSGFLPSILALIQGIGGNPECITVTNPETGLPETQSYQSPPRFDTQEYFYFVFGFFIMSLIAFTFLDKLKICKTEYAAVTINHGNDYTYSDGISTIGNDMKMDLEDVGKTKKMGEEKVKALSPYNYKYLLILMGIVCMFGNGVFPSIQSYSCLPYNNLAYHLTVTLSSIANPVACFLAVFLPHTSIRSITTLSVLAGGVAAYVMTTALMSPTPPLSDHAMGGVLVVAAWTLLVGLHSYVRLCITTIFRTQGGKSLVWVGAVTQIGSFIGAIVTYFFVNHTEIFKQYYPCQ